MHILADLCITTQQCIHDHVVFGFMNEMDYIPKG